MKESEKKSQRKTNNAFRAIQDIRRAEALAFLSLPQHLQDVLKRPADVDITPLQHIPTGAQ
jgi:hypothetical protein